MKVEVGELYYEVRGLFYRILGRYLTGVVKAFYVKSMFLLRFQYVCDKGMTLNQLAFMKV